MSWPLTLAQTFALVSFGLLASAVAFADLCVRAIDRRLDERAGEPALDDDGEANRS